MSEMNKRAVFLESVKDKWWWRVEAMELARSSERFLLNQVLLPSVYTEIERLFRRSRAELSFRDDPDFVAAYEGEFEDIYKNPDHLIDVEDNEAMTRYVRSLDLKDIEKCN
jgi:hypothetical protein